MTTVENSPLAKMGAETGYDLDDSAPPLRVSGFLALLFGALSIVSTLGQPLLVLPVLALFFGGFALRRSSGPVPVGTTAAKIGLVLAVGFGSCGLFLPWFKWMTLGSQAEQFARQYMEVIARGDDLLAMELRKDYANRLPTEMNLEEHYAINQNASRAWEEFRSESINDVIRNRGLNAEWVLAQPVRVYYHYGEQHAEIIWRDPTESTRTKVRMFLIYNVDSKGDGQWYVKTCVQYSEPIVAEYIL